MANTELEFAGPILMTSQSKFEDVVEVLEDFNVTTSFDSWFVRNQNYIANMNESVHYHVATLHSPVTKAEIEKFVSDNKVSLFLLEGPTGIYNNTTLTAGTVSGSKLDDLIENVDGQMVLYRIYKVTDNKGTQYKVRYATYNGV